MGQAEALLHKPHVLAGYRAPLHAAQLRGCSEVCSGHSAGSLAPHGQEMSQGRAGRKARGDPGCTIPCIPMASQGGTSPAAAFHGSPLVPAPSPPAHSALHAAQLCSRGLSPPPDPGASSHSTPLSLTAEGWLGWMHCATQDRCAMSFPCEPSELLLPGGPTQTAQCQQPLHAHMCACGHRVHLGIPVDTVICAQAPPLHPAHPTTPSIAHLQGKWSTVGAARAVPSPRGLGVNLCISAGGSGFQDRKMRNAARV